MLLCSCFVPNPHVTTYKACKANVNSINIYIYIVLLIVSSCNS